MTKKKKPAKVQPPKQARKGRTRDEDEDEDLEDEDEDDEDDEDDDDEDDGGRRSGPPPAPRASVDIAPDGVLAARNHFLQTLGTPAQVFDLRGKTKPFERLEVGIFAPPAPTAPGIFATVGASQLVMKDGNSFEAVMMVKPAPEKEQAEALARMLVGLAAYPLRVGEAIGAGAVIHSPDEVRAACGMDALVLLPPMPFADKFKRFRKRDGRWVQILWVVPVHESEAKFCETAGVAKFWDALTKHQVDLAQLGRPAYDLANPPKPKAAPPPAKGAAKPGAAPAKPGTPAKPAPPAARPGAVPAKPAAPAAKAPPPPAKGAPPKPPAKK